MNRETFMRLGDCIQSVDVRNKMGLSSKPMGVNIEKFFMPSVANVIGTDLGNYKVVCQNQFACNLMHVGRDERLPVALHESESPIIVSPAYFVFEIKPEVKLLPSFLMIWFRRQEFDRRAWFYTDSDVRGGLDREALLDIEVPVPDVEIQNRVVAQYNTIQHSIQVNTAIVSMLEDTALAMFRKLFVDDVNYDELPNKWSRGTLSDVANITMGQSPEGESLNIDREGVIFYQGKTDFGIRFPSVRMYTSTPKKYAEPGSVLLSVRAPVGDINIAETKCCIGRGLAAISSKTGANSYLYYLLRFLYPEFNKYNGEGEGTVFGSINGDALNNMEIIVPDPESIKLYNTKVSPIDDYIRLLLKEIDEMNKALKIL